MFKNSNKSKGFTLIEILIVIVILGILAATAAPKFFNFTAEAQTSVLQTIQASIEGGVALVHNKSIVTGAQNVSSSTVVLAAGSVGTTFGYPLNTATIAYWTRIGVIDANSNISINAVSGGALLFYSNDQGTLTSTSDNCVVVYNAPTMPNTPPTITLNECI